MAAPECSAEIWQEVLVIGDLVVYAADDEQARGLFVISALHHCGKWLADQGVRVRFVAAHQVAVVLAIEALRTECGISVKIEPSRPMADPKVAFEGGALYVGVVSDQPGLLERAEARQRGLECIIGVQFPRDEMLSAECLAMLRSAHDARELAERIRQAVSRLGGPGRSVEPPSPPSPPACVPLSFGTSRVRRRGDAPVILIVCMISSPHTARWVDCIRGRGLKVVLFPCGLCPACPELAPTREVRTVADVEALPVGEVGVVPWQCLPRVPRDAQILRTRFPADWAEHKALPCAEPLRDLIEALQPDLVHSMELQYSAYLTLEARMLCGSQLRFPPWLVSSWGGDLYLFRKFEAHLPIILELAREADGWHGDCVRDVQWVKESGFRGMEFPHMPASGGVDFADYPDPRQLPPPSERRTLLVKGYQSWAGRGADLMMALHRAAPVLRDYEILVTHGNPAVAAQVERLARADGLNIRVNKYLQTNAQALHRMASARVVMGYGVADGIATTLLEAMAVGTFMIQADSCCGHEWIEPGRTGLVVPQHDVVALSDALALAVTDDDLVDRAVAENRATVETRWSSAVNGPRIVRGYLDLIATRAHG
jgi:hypothetical protein